MLRFSCIFLKEETNYLMKYIGYIENRRDARKQPRPTGYLLAIFTEYEMCVSFQIQTDGVFYRFLLLPFATLHVTFSLFGMKIFSQSNVTCPEKEISIICDQFVITGFSLFDKLEGLNLD